MSDASVMKHLIDNLPSGPSRNASGPCKHLRHSSLHVNWAVEDTG